MKQLGAWAVKALLVLALLGIAPAVAHAEEDAAAERDQDQREAIRRKRIVKALAQGVEALQALGGHEELEATLREVLTRVKGGSVKPRKRGKAKHANAEREAAAQHLKVYRLAHDVLTDSDREDEARIVEHATHALELGLEGRRDDEAVRIRKSSPDRVQIAGALVTASELLIDREDARRAKLVLTLAQKFRDHERRRRAREHEGKERERKGDEDFEGGLERRVDILRLAVVALHEAERKDLAETLTRGIHTGELMLAGREDEEARKVFQRTPKLGQLAEILGFASRKWAEFGNAEKAAACQQLSDYYAKRSGAQREEEQANERAQAHEREARDAAEQRQAARNRTEKDERGADERAKRLERVRRELAEMHEMLQRIDRRLKALGGHGR